MNIEQQLNTLADGYRSRGFQVVVRPGPDDLPPFARDFKVEILAKGPDVNALASVKTTPAELEADPNLEVRESIEKQPGWRSTSLSSVPTLGCPRRSGTPSSRPRTTSDGRWTKSSACSRRGSSRLPLPPHGGRWRRRCAGAFTPAAGGQLGDDGPNDA